MPHNFYSPTTPIFGSVTVCILSQFHACFDSNGLFAGRVTAPRDQPGVTRGRTDRQRKATRGRTGAIRGRRGLKTEAIEKRTGLVRDPGAKADHRDTPSKAPRTEDPIVTRDLPVENINQRADLRPGLVRRPEPDP